MSSNDRPMTSIWITFTDRTTRSTFTDVVLEIRRKFDVKVAFFSDDDGFSPSAYFEGRINPNEALLYSRLSKKARKSIQSMDVWIIDCLPDRDTTSIQITFVDGTPRFMFDGVIRQIGRKFGVKVTYSGSPVWFFEGTIDPDEAFLLYSRKLSKRARRSIRISVEQCIRRPASSFSISWLLFPSNHEEGSDERGRDGDYGVLSFLSEADVNTTEEIDIEALRDQLRFWFGLGDWGFRIDAVPTLSDDPDQLYPQWYWDRVLRRDERGPNA